MSVAVREPAMRVAVDVTFLRMEAPPSQPPSALSFPQGAQVVRAGRCTVPFYRYLYDTVGQQHVWWLRRSMSDAELAALLARPEISIHVLYMSGEPAGFYELERRGGEAGINLSYFGLMPHAIGKGLGRALLRHAVDRAWAEKPQLMTVNTCTADHPRALPNYIDAGFRVVRTVKEIWPVPVRLGLPIPSHLKTG
jgi:GNAT superfamily N-acetyltransferase